jgi:hypothetical protein
MQCLRDIGRPRSPIAALLLNLLAAGCGSGPSGPSGSPTPTPTPTPPLTPSSVTGRYLVQITPGPGCNMSRAPLSFPMVAAPAGTAPHPGVQVVLDGNPGELELEFLFDNGTLRGGLGTTGDGVLANEALRLWMHAVGNGALTRARDGRAEIVMGTLMGYVALGRPNNDEGALGTCSARDHTFTLRIR